MAAATATKATTSSKPAKAGTEGGIGVQELAAKLEIEPRTLRVFLREQGYSVGFGSRYSWTSLSDPEVKRIIAAWEKAAQQAA
jgi:hypothetical protein